MFPIRYLHSCYEHPRHAHVFFRPLRHCVIYSNMHALYEITLSIKLKQICSVLFYTVRLSLKSFRKLVNLSPIRMRKKYTRVNILRCVFILRCANPGANQPESKFKLRSHGFYRQEYYHFWIKTCSFKFSVFAKQEEAASSCSCRLWQRRGIM